MVNRTDRHGRYLPLDQRTAGKSRSYTAGKLHIGIVKAHFTANVPALVIGLHTTSKANTSRWFAIEVDQHGDDDQHAADVNFSAVVHWQNKLADLGLSSLLTDSNGRGGYHLHSIFDGPAPTADMFAFAKSLIADWQTTWLTSEPETFPKQRAVTPETPYGNWLRVFGRHHTRAHYSRVWCDGRWLEGHAAIDVILATTLNPVELIPPAPAPAPKPAAAKARINGYRYHGNGMTSRDIALYCLSCLSSTRADDRQTWLETGMALHSADPTDSMLSEWDQWSRQSTKWTPTCCATAWKSFKTSGGITLGSLVQWRGATTQRSEPMATTSTSSTTADLDNDDTPAADCTVSVQDDGADNVARLCSDLGNAARFAKQHLDRLMWVNGLGWLYYDGKRWVPDLMVYVLACAKKTALSIGCEALVTNDDDERARLFKHVWRSQGRERLMAMIDLAKPELAAPITALDADPWR